MAIRHQKMNVADLENMNPRPAQSKLSKQPSLRRAALDELSNKVTEPKDLKNKEGRSKAATKKNEVSKAATSRGKENATVTKEPNEQKSYSSQQLEPVIDLSIDSHGDPQMVPEYAQEIYNYLLEMEDRFPVNETFLEGHPTTPKKRAILVNWLVQVHTSFKLCLETLYTCVSIIDRYLQVRKHINRETLQLVGAAALYVASKYEEMYIPDISDFVYICEETHSKRQIFKAERDILKALDYTLGKPLAVHFLRRFSRIAKVRPEQHNLAKYILELSLIDHKLSTVKPSKQAAAACFLSMIILSNAATTFASKVWTPTLVHYSSYKFGDIKTVVCRFADMLLNAGTLKMQAIQAKYSEAKYNKVSVHPKLKGFAVKKLAESSTKT